MYKKRKLEKKIGLNSSAHKNCMYPLTGKIQIYSMKTAFVG